VIEERKDGKNPFIVVNEERDSKASKYLIRQVQYPFKTNEEYERSIRYPMEYEWKTLSSFVDGVKPQVVVKRRSMIEPVKWHGKKKNSQEEEIEAEEV